MNMISLNSVSLDGNTTRKGGSSSNANVQAVDIGETVDGLEIEYTTKTYVDGLVGDINSVLESIINS